MARFRTFRGTRQGYCGRRCDCARRSLSYSSRLSVPPEYSLSLWRGQVAEFFRGALEQRDRIAVERDAQVTARGNREGGQKA
jgi:hypothetical protein